MRRWKLLLSVVTLLVLTVNANAQFVMGDYTEHTTDETSVTVIATDAALRFTFLQEEIVRVEYLPTLETVFDSSLVVVHTDANAILPQIVDEEYYLELVSNALTVHISKNPVRVRFDGDSGILTEEDQSGGHVAIGGQRTMHYSLAPGEHLYGTGERGHALDLRGEAFDCENRAIYGYGQAPETMNINVPFYMSSKGYGLFIDTPWTGRFDLGESRTNYQSFTCNGGELRYYFIVGEDYGEILEQYTWLTGRQPLPPKWSLGYIQSKYGYRNETEVRELANQFRTREIPADGIILDLYWFENMGDYAWNTSAFPNPAQMINDLTDDGFNTVLITEPYFNEYSDNYSYLYDNPENVGHWENGDPFVIENHWSCGCDALLVDATCPDMQDWWQDKYETLLADGIAGFWTDLGEPENHPWEMQHALGSRDEVHNIYNLLWAETVADAFETARPTERVFNLTRSGYAGIQRYGVNTWSGDVSRTFEGLAAQRAMLLNMGLSGIAYHSSDLGGFTGTTSPELYIRWMQFGAFNPVMRAHGYDNHGTEPWAFGDEAEEIVSEFIRLRYRLMPYSYSLAYENHLHGTPIVRPLFYEFPNDPNVADYDEAFMYGPNILVAPVVQDRQRNKSVYLPDGEWVSYWDDRVYYGEQTVTVPATLDQMPIFIRQGSVIPMQSDEQYVDETSLDTLFLKLYPGTYVWNYLDLYEDDGITTNYESGASAVTSISAEYWELYTSATGDMGFMVSIDPTEGTYEGLVEDRVYMVETHNVVAEPRSIIGGDESMEGFDSMEELLDAGEGYYYEAEPELLYVLFSKSADESFFLSITDPWADTPEDPVLPYEFSLSQNYPNPFNPSTEVRFTVAELSNVRIQVYDILGREVTTLVNRQLPPGAHQVVWNGLSNSGTPVSAGMYFCTMEAGEFSKTVKMLLLK